MTLEYALTFCDVPFVIDVARTVAMRYEYSTPENSPKRQLPPEKHQSESELLDEIDRLICFDWTRDVTNDRAGVWNKNLAGVARVQTAGSSVDHDVTTYRWYYPPTASRFSVFRGLMTSTGVKEIIRQTENGSKPGTLVVGMRPHSTVAENTNVTSYRAASYMYLLPPRPLGETAGTIDGLYLVTLVDVRYHMLRAPVSLVVNQNSTWYSLLADLATAAGIFINVIGDIPEVYGRPDADSPLWTCGESVAVLIDAVAHNIGKVAVRDLAGTFSLITPSESRTRVYDNRGPLQRVERFAGGDMFASGGNLPVGLRTLTYSRNLPITNNVVVQFPKYVAGDDPVPHYLNPKFRPQRPSAWNNDSFGETYGIVVPIASGGSLVSQLTGISGTTSLHCTAKAVYQTEQATVSGEAPDNSSGLTALAMQLGQNYWYSRSLVALDEVYPGILNWPLDGIHDVIWTYSERSKQATTRVCRTEWNQIVDRFQHATPPAFSGATYVPKGVGGPPIALNVRDSVQSGGPPDRLKGNIFSGNISEYFYVRNGGTFFEGNSRVQVDGEVMWCGPAENTESGVRVPIIYRGIDGTSQAGHVSGAPVFRVVPNSHYGVNLVTFSDSFTTLGGTWSSGGIQEVHVKVAQGGISSGMIASGAFPMGSGTGLSGYNVDYVNNYYSYFTWQYNNYFISSGTTTVDPGNIVKMRLVTSGDVYIRRITNGVQGRILVLWNAGAYKITLADLQGGSDSIMLPLGTTVLGTSGFASGYTIYPRNGVILEYDRETVSGVWRFDHPTMAAGNYGSTGFAGQGPPIDYAIQHLRFGSGLLYQSYGDGSANVYVASGVGGGGGSLTNGFSEIPSAYDTTNAYASTGVTFNLPSAGTYLITATVYSTLTASNAGDSMEIRIRDTTAGSTVGSMEGTAALIQSAPPALATLTDTKVATLAFYYSTAGTPTIELQAKHSVLTPAVTARVNQAQMYYVKIA